MMFCTYCGKGFTRKEHLERHIPSHTNVKPHRCSSCQLSFARRDLLQRHYSTYHEVRDPLAPLPAGIPHSHGRTPIACQHCANAKTGCDKRVPCSRCTEKSLPCAPRFARRSSKAALRAAQAAASAAYSTIVQEQQEQAQPAQADVPVAFMEIDVTNPEQHQQQQDAIMAKPAGTPTTPVFPDVARQNAHQNHSHHQQHHQQQPMQQQQSMQQQQHLQHQQQHQHQHSQPHPQQHPSHPQQQTTPDPSRRQSHEFSSPHSNGVDGLDQFMYLSGEFVAPEAAAAAAAGYPAELLVWPEYSLELGGMYPGPIPAAAVRPEMSLHMFQHQHQHHHNNNTTDNNHQHQHQLPPNHQNHTSHTNIHHTSAANYSHHALSSLNTNNGHAGGGGPSPLIHRDHIQAHHHHHSISYSNNSHGPHYGTEVSDASAATSEPMTATSSRVSIHTRATSIVSAEADGPTKPERIDSDGEIAEADDDDADSGGSSGSPGGHIPEMIAAEAAWPLARCNPPIFSGNCPRTAIIHLECLERKSKDEGTWSSLESYLAKVDWDASDLASVVPMSSRTRDRMLAIAQSFLHKALDVHRGGIHHGGHRRHRQRRQQQQSAAAARYYCYPASAGGDFNFIVLPPTKILEYFLRSYVRNLSNYFTLVVAGCVDPNEMLINNQASTLLLLLMIAQGAAAVPMAEARSLSAGLTETCRISLFDIIEKDVELSADPVALRCALLFMILGAWSGDKWLMDIVMGQRGMYLSMLRHAGMLEPQPSMIPTLDGAADVELQWRDWLQRDGRNRLVYNWVMVDQELSLFHDTAPMLSITDLQCPLPAPEALWMCSESKQWYATMQRTYGCNTNVSPHLITGGNTLTPSLLDLFQDLLHDRLHRRQSHPTPHQLRLLLHPIQAMLYHLGQTVSCFGGAASSSSLMPSASSATSGAVSAAASAAASPLPGPSPPTARDATMRRLDEVHDLLDRWYELARAMHAASPSCMAMRCNLVLYHLIRLNAVTNFLEIERLARREGLLDPSSASYWDLIAARHSRCVYHSDDALMHCGQVMRLLRSIPIDRRPAWWPAAVYRATLIMWADSLARSQSVRQRHRQQSASATPTASCVVPISAPLQQPTPPQQRSPRGSPTQMHCRQGSPTAASAAVAFAPPPPAPPQHPVAIDQIQPGDPGLAQCLSGDGVAHLTRGDGSTFAIDDRPGDVLAYGTMAIDEGAGTRIGDGIKRKLATLGTNWGLEMAAYC